MFIDTFSNEYSRSCKIVTGITERSYISNMALPSSGTITIAQISAELGTTGARGLGDADGRKLAGVPTGSIALSNYYSKFKGWNFVQFSSKSWDSSGKKRRGTCSAWLYYTDGSLAYSRVCNECDNYVVAGEYDYMAVKKYAMVPVNKTINKVTLKRRIDTNSGGNASMKIELFNGNGDVQILLNISNYRTGDGWEQKNWTVNVSPT